MQKITTFLMFNMLQMSKIDIEGLKRAYAGQ